MRAELGQDGNNIVLYVYADSEVEGIALRAWGEQAVVSGLDPSIRSMPMRYTLLHCKPDQSSTSEYQEK